MVGFLLSRGQHDTGSLGQLGNVGLDERIESQAIGDGVAFEPDSGFTPSAIEAGTGLAADTHEVAGALSSERITPDSSPEVAAAGTSGA